MLASIEQVNTPLVFQAKATNLFHILDVAKNILNEKYFSAHHI